MRKKFSRLSISSEPTRRRYRKRDRHSFSTSIRRRRDMRYMVIVKANKDSEEGVLPDKVQLDAMGAFNQQLIDAGVMLAGEGLAPSSEGFRIRYKNGTNSIIDGPFAESKELVAG